MLDEKRFNQFGFLRSAKDIKGICVHETSNYELNAQQLFDYLNNESKTTQACHYFIDDKDVIEVMPHNWGVYHTGKGMDYGNKFTIAIEIVSSLSNEKYAMAEEKAINLIKQLMKDYSIGIDGVFFHIDFNDKTYCPKTLINKYGTSRKFAIAKLKEE